jgi:glyoxalase family protein
MMAMGIHHITGIAGDPQRNLDFYTTALGLRLVKLTVNFDDPGTYHFYFGDELGRPGSILTFFPWPGGRPGRHGTGQVGTVSLAIPPASLGYWLGRLLAQGVTYTGPTRRFDERVIELRDPDGLLLELVATPRVDSVEPWGEGTVPPEHAIRGLHGATIWEDGDQGTAELLTDRLSFREVGQEENRLRLEASAEGAGTVIDLRRAPGFWGGAGGVGTVHHVAFRAATGERQLALRAELEQLDLGITPVIDRQYFHSVYFREPGGVLFEIATDGPGFALDEPPGELGSHLMLPPMYQPMREQIEGSLPALRLPAVPERAQ